MAYRENCLGKLAQHSLVLFILFACWFCYCISYCLIYSNELRHLQRYSKPSRPPTTEKQFLCIFLIQIKIYFLQFFSVWHSMFNFYKISPKSCRGGNVGFSTFWEEEEKGSILFIGMGSENTSISQATQVGLALLSKGAAA